MPRMQSRMVFVLPATKPMMLPPACRSAAAFCSTAAQRRPMRELARAEVPQLLPVASIVAKLVEPAPAPLVPAPAPVFERPSEKLVIQRLLRPASSSGQTAHEQSRPQRPSRPADSEVRRRRRAAPQTDPAPSRQVDSAAGRPRHVGPQRRGAEGGVRSDEQVRPPSLPWQRTKPTIDRSRSSSSPRRRTRRRAQRPHRRHRVARARIHRRRRRPRAARGPRTRPRPRRSGPAGGTPHSFQARAVGRPARRFARDRSHHVPLVLARGTYATCNIPLLLAALLAPALRRRSPVRRQMIGKVQRPRRQAAPDRSRPTTSSTG